MYLTVVLYVGVCIAYCFVSLIGFWVCVGFVLFVRLMIWLFVSTGLYFRLVVLCLGDWFDV